MIRQAKNKRNRIINVQWYLVKLKIESQTEE